MIPTGRELARAVLERGVERVELELREQRGLLGSRCEVWRRDGGGPWRRIARARGRRHCREVYARETDALRRAGFAPEGGTRALPAERRWDWLFGLLDGSPHGEIQLDPLYAALAELGLPAEDVLAGLAEALDLAPDRLERPRPQDLHQVARSRLARVLPVWLELPDPRLAAAARRWLELPQTAYGLTPEELERWLAGEGALARDLAPRLATEGLALLEPARLRSLAGAAALPEVRRAAQAWVRRLSPPGES